MTKGLGSRMYGLLSGVSVLNMRRKQGRVEYETRYE